MLNGAHCSAMELSLNDVVTKKPKKRVKREPSRKAIRQTRAGGTSFARIAADLAEIGKGFHARGWVLGTSGNFSAVISREPLRLAITSTGLDKSSLAPAQFLEMDDAANIVRGDGRPPAEALLHLAIPRRVRPRPLLPPHSLRPTLRPRPPPP